MADGACARASWNVLPKVQEQKFNKVKRRKWQQQEKNDEVDLCELKLFLIWQYFLRGWLNLVALNRNKTRTNEQEEKMLRNKWNWAAYGLCFRGIWDGFGHSLWCVLGVGIFGEVLLELPDGGINMDCLRLLWGQVWGSLAINGEHVNLWFNL